MRDHPYRVVQWSTGAMGRSMLRGILSRDGYELAGVHVHDPEKVGLDAGEMVGYPPAGVLTSADPAEITALDADCVLYAPLDPTLVGGDPYGDLDVICGLLSSGKNLISVSGLVYPWAHGPRLTTPLEKACATGGVSVYGTGINPGFMSDVAPLTLAGMCRKVTHVYARECSDWAGHASRRLAHDLMGLGKPEREYLEGLHAMRSAMRQVFTESLHLTAAGLGMELDHIDVDLDYVLADEDFEIASGTVARGTVAAQRWRFNGMVGGIPLLTVETVHKSDARRIHHWNPPGYALRVEGTPSMMLEAGPDWVSNAVSAAAAHAVNAIPAVCAAAPGIRTRLDLPLMPGPAVLRP